MIFNQLSLKPLQPPLPPPLDPFSNPFPAPSLIPQLIIFYNLPFFSYLSLPLHHIPNHVLVGYDSNQPLISSVNSPVHIWIYWFRNKQYKVKTIMQLVQIFVAHFADKQLPFFYNAIFSLFYDPFHPSHTQNQSIFSLHFYHDWTPQIRTGMWLFWTQLEIKNNSPFSSWHSQLEQTQLPLTCHNSSLRTLDYQSTAMLSAIDPTHWGQDSSPHHNWRHTPRRHLFNSSPGTINRPSQTKSNTVPWSRFQCAELFFQASGDHYIPGWNRKSGAAAWVNTVSTTTTKVIWTCS